jgi:uncharacterized protein YraI
MLHKVVRYVRLVAFGLSCLVPCKAAHGQDGSYSAYTTAALRLRSEPTLDGSVVALMPRGASVRVQSCENDWCAVVFRRSSGFAAEQYLSRERPAVDLLITGRGYYNSQGVWVPSPTRTRDGRPPAGASAQCRDRTYSFSMSRRGTCSHHGGVARWL